MLQVYEDKVEALRDALRKEVTEEILAEVA